MSDPTEPVAQYMYLQPWGHGPIYVSWPDGRLQARCLHAGCGWVGPDRTGSPGDYVFRDAEWHAHDMGARFDD